ncbi:hypothetical protein ACPEEZ_13025 [Frigoribacterium sp. 2-23]|uniref:hypothetical protein n=1 Tax=Frigoribacterium sp. 2-23 TaxID=3415006 RepID=UPI003C6F903E
MAENSYDYFFSGDHDSARRLIDQTLQNQGFSLEILPNGSTKATRGSLAKTLLLGGLAGKGFHITMFVQYFVDEHGRLVARLHRELGGSMIKGGAIGAAKGQNAFADVANALNQAAAAGGHLEGTASA